MPRVPRQRRAYRLHHHRAAEREARFPDALAQNDRRGSRRAGAASSRLERRANPKTLFNGGTDFSSLCFSLSGRTALAPGGGVQMAAERTAHARLMPPNETGGAVRLFK